MPKIRLKRGDLVRVIAGKHKGEEGKLLAVFRDTNRVIIERVNVIRRTQRPTQDNPRGGFAEREAPIHASNVQIIDPNDGELTRIGYKTTESGQKIRVSVKSGAELGE